MNMAAASVRAQYHKGYHRLNTPISYIFFHGLLMAGYVLQAEIKA